MLDKCIGCIWSDVTMRDDSGTPVQIYCLPHAGGCPKGDSDELENPIDRIEE